MELLVLLTIFRLDAEEPAADCKPALAILNHDLPAQQQLRPAKMEAFVGPVDQQSLVV